MGIAIGSAGAAVATGSYASMPLEDTIIINCMWLVKGPITDFAWSGGMTCI